MPAGDASRPATVDDVHRLAAALPGAKRLDEASGVVVWQVSGRSFLFFRNPRPDALDPETGQRLTDVIVIWVPDEGEKRALVDDLSTPFFTTQHFNGHLSVLVRASQLNRIAVDELGEIIEQAWMCRASKTAVRKRLAERQREANG